MVFYCKKCRVLNVVILEFNCYHLPVTVEFKNKLLLVSKINP
jgi:hypothetical protein